MEQKSYLEKNYVEAKKTYETFHKFNEKDIDLKKFPFKQDDLSMSKKKYIEEFLREQKIKNKSIERDIIDFQKKKIELSNKQYPH